MSSKDTKDLIEVKEEAEVKSEKPKRKRESRTDIKKRMFLKALEETLGELVDHHLVEPHIHFVGQLLPAHSLGRQTHAC